MKRTNKRLISAATATSAAIKLHVSEDPADLIEIFGRFLRLYVADGDASPATMRTYRAQAAQFVAWCQQSGLNPAIATEEDIISYRKHLVEAGYKPTTIGLKLAVVRRLYEAIRWRGLRHDNPAAGIKVPRDRTSRDERVKYLSLEGLKRLLAAPQVTGRWLGGIERYWRSWGSTAYVQQKWQVCRWKTST